MKEIELNKNDILRLRADIKISIVLGLLFTLALVIIVGLIPGVMFIFGKRPSDGFVTRGLYIIGLLFIPFLAISWTNILKYIDLKQGKKLTFKTDDYDVINKKDSAYILTRGDNKQKIKIDNELIPFIKSSQPLTIEISTLAKSLLFISHNTDNLLDKLYNDKKQ
ncbi:MAG: hypothetical protein KG003_14290 [Bacteroidetes bacterium]|nr:hypothetical protein [Bacteroidota bacterium]